MANLKFNKHHITNGTVKARVWYSLDNRTDRRECITIYAKDYSDTLCALFGSAAYINDTDTMTDYFEKGRVVLFPGMPGYDEARAKVQAFKAADAAKRAAA